MTARSTAGTTGTTGTTAGTTALRFRPGSRPSTTRTALHAQLDQQPDAPDLTEQILARASSWPGAGVRASTLTVPGARGLVLDADEAGGPPEAFLDAHEFVHAHAGPDHSLHLALPPRVADAATTGGWAEPHPGVRSGRVPGTVVLVYAPRDEDEAATVLGLVRASYEFARGTGVPA